MSPDVRDLLIELYRAAIEGAHVESLTSDAVATIPLERRDRVWLFAFGKAARAMAAAAIAVLQRELSEIVGGVIVVPDDGDAMKGALVTVRGDHPIPGDRSLAAAERIGDAITRKRGDVGIVLISGGTSSMIAAPLRGMSHADLIALYELLLRSGLDIHAMNAVRKRFSLWAAGRLALALAPARTFCFAVSDVPGDDLGSIGSGPCVPDLTRAQQVIDSLKAAELWHRIASSLRRHLEEVARGAIPETPKPTHPAFAHVVARVIANNACALTGAAAGARRHGAIVITPDEQLTGDAAKAGERVAAELISIRAAARPNTLTCCLWGGETTVQLGASTASGGRCQELALSVAHSLAHAGSQAAGISALAAGTDGRDGTTDVAGAFVDAVTWSAVAAAGRDPLADLRDHRAHDALASVNALFAPGPTGTNVMDVVIGLVRV